MVLSLSYDAAAQLADALVVDVFVDGALSRSMNVPRAAHESRGQVEIQFAHDYPTGKQLSVRVTGQRAGETVASAFADTLAGDLCSALSMSLSERGAPTPGGTCLPMTCGSASEACGQHNDGCGGVLDCGACAIFSMSSPPTLAANAKVTLEGRFTRDASVRFAGASAPSTPTLARPHRLEVIVPADATEGPLLVTSGGTTLRSPRFRRAVFALGVARVDRAPTQTTFARRATTPARGATTSFSYGGFAYLVGGATQPPGQPPTAGTTIHRARINADGAIDGFAALSSSHLAVAVYNHSTVLVGRHVFVIGGMTAPDAPPSKVVQRASFDDDGVLGEFAVVGNLTVGRRQTDAIVLGRYVYVIGGNTGSQVLPAIERATIESDGSLSPFSVDAAQLNVARGGHRVLTTHGKLFVVGGDDGSRALSSIESAEVAPDGSLSDFVVSAETLMSARTDLSIAAIGDFLYALGGRNTQALATIERASIGDDGVLGAFSFEVASLFRPRFGAGLAWAGDTLQMLGGSEGGATGPTSAPEILQLNSSGALDGFAAAPQASLPVTRAHGCAFVIGDAVWVLGGLDASGRSDEILRAPLSSEGVPSAFVRVGALPEARSHAACAINRGRVHLLGGLTGSSASPVRSRATLSAAIGEDGLVAAFEAGPNLVATHASASAAFVSDRLYVIGGGPDEQKWIEVATAQGDDTLGAFTKALDPSDTAINLGREAHGTIVLNDAIYALGGISGAGAELSSIARIPILAAGLGASTTLDLALAEPRATFAAFVLGPSLYLSGGGPTLRPLERLAVAGDGTLTAPSAADTPTLATNRQGHRALVAARRVLIVGGNAGDTEIAVAR